MSDKVINLRRARKSRHRDTARAKAAGNAAFHGLTLHEKELAAAQAKKQRMEVDARKRED